VVAQHLLYTDNHGNNPFSCMLASDLYLPKEWGEDRDRCREARIPDNVVYRPKWQIAVEQVKAAVGNGIRFSWIVFDAEYGRVPNFWYAMDELGQRVVGEVPKDFRAWATPPAYRSVRSEYASKKVKDLVTYSPVFRRKSWRRMKVKTTTRGPIFLEVKAARVQLAKGADPQGNTRGSPTDRRYWLIATRNPATGETRYWVSNAPADADLKEMLGVALARWHVEKWFERAKQEVGLGAFEVRTYISLTRHWLTCRVAMLFLACQTWRLRGEKSADHVGTSGGGGEQPGVELLESMAELAEEPGREVQLPPAA
jgi:SRSO17 transposase